MIRIQAHSRVPLDQVKARYGSHATHDDYDVLISGDALVYGPDGSPLLMVRRKAIPEDVASAAYPHMHWLQRAKSDNRGVYAGQADRIVKVKKDGTVSRTTRSKPVASAVIGYYPRYPRIPFCRETAFTANNVDRWTETRPMIKHVADRYAAEKKLGARYRKQLSEAGKVHDEFMIPGTPFTTVTVNNCVAASYHQDKGDFKEGFGCMSVFRRGQYTGGQLVFPRYRIAVDLHDRDLIFFDPHEWHGNVPMEGEGPEGKPENGGWERISMVYYMRTQMLDCGSAEEERLRAASRATELMEER